MAYQMVAMVVTLNDLEGHSSVAGLFKCHPSNTYAAFYTISTDSVLAWFLCISRASCLFHFEASALMQCYGAVVCCEDVIHTPTAKIFSLQLQSNRCMFCDCETVT